MENLNLFGAEMKFIYDGKILYKTSIGMFLSILFYILTGVFIFLTGQDFLKRQNPKSFISSAYDNDYKIHNFTNLDAMFRIIGFTEFDMNDTSIIDFRVSYIKYLLKGSEVIPIQNDPIKIIKCNNQHIKTQKMIDTFDLDTFLCFDKKDFEIGGYWDGSYANYLSFQVVKCFNKPNCKSIKEIDEYLTRNNLFLQFIVPETTVNPNDYNNGLESVPRSVFTSIDPMFASYNDVFFKFTNIITDYGWISKEIKSGFNLGYYYENKKYFKTKEDNIIIGNHIFISKSSVTVNREYPKIQTLLAELGGILNFFIIVFKTLSNIYASFHLKLKLIKALNQNNSGLQGEKLFELKLSQKRDLNNDSLSATKNEPCSINKYNLKQNNISDVKNENQFSNVFELKNSNNISINSNSNGFDKESNNIELKDKIIIKPLKIEDPKNSNQIKFDNTEKIKILKQSLNHLDNLKHIEDKVDISYTEPISMFMHLNFPCCFNKDKIKQYEEINNEYDNYFEFHNLMLLDHKLSILIQTILDDLQIK